MAIADIPNSSLQVPADAPELRSRRFTVDEYVRLIALGMFGDDERLELLEGLIVPMMTRVPPHEVALRLVSKALDRRLPAGYDLRVQSSIQLGASVPEPDCTIVIGETRHYIDHHPSASEIALVVEVSDSSLRIDRTTKARIYAAAGISIYWIVNLPERQLEVWSDPTGEAEQPGYLKTLVFKVGENVSLVLGDKQVGDIAVADLLP
ncbi:MAG: Uma2 family endonuclease [Planctomycetia bacterium]|nr:Uma2 family endonuclease [Planctomycetia bacterium]